MSGKVKIEQSPLVNPDTAIVKIRRKDQGIEFKTLRLFRDLAKAVSPPPVLTALRSRDSGIQIGRLTSGRSWIP